jgi:Tol biopolymer transport system component
MSGISPATHRRLYLALAWAVGLSAAALAPGRLEAQYFGRNKVVYDSFDFRVLRTEHFDIYFYPAESAAVADAARMAERWYVRHSVTMRDTFSRKPIVLYADNPSFQQTNVVSGYLQEGIGGVTEPSRSRAVLFFSGAYADDDHVLGHELVHVFQFDIAGLQRGGYNNMARLPGWSIEGMAEYLSLGRDDPNTAMWLRDAALRNDLPTVKKLGVDPHYFPYRYGEALWAYIGGRYGDSIIGPLYRATLRVGPDQAIRQVLGIPTDTLSKQWLQSIRDQYLADARTRTPPQKLGTRILTPSSKRYGDFDVGPALSPDGNQIAFFSSRGLFDIGLFVADANTGHIIRSLTSPNTDPHFDALSFVTTAGSWSPDSKYIAVPAFAQGKVDVEIFDARAGGVKQHFTLPGIGAVLQIAWGPNDQLAISGMANGWSGLYLYDMKTKQSTELAHSRYAETEPAWSPDGHTLAYVTDSGPLTNFKLLTYGPMQIALMDMTTPTHPVRLLPLFPGRAKQVNPQFAPDGQSLYFVSDPDGVPDIYKVGLATGTITRITRVATGVSGVTATSPTLSVAPGDGRLAFSVFENGGYSLHRLNADEAQGEPVTLAMADSDAFEAVEPPDVPGGGAVTERIHDPRTGLPPEHEFDVIPYRPTLGLDAIGTGGVGVSFGGALGTGVAGGVAFEFGDELGNNLVFATVQANGQLQSIGGQAAYLNQTHRWNYGLSISHIPYLQLGQGAYDTTIVNGGTQTPAQVIENQYLYTYYDALQLFTQYPLSMTHRFEFGVGFTWIHYALYADRYLALPNGAVYQLQLQAPQPAPPGLGLWQGTVAYAVDYSQFGFTSPVAGGRERVELDPTVGSLVYTTAMIDYRKYFLFRPFTLAFRGFTYGRYGRDADSPQLSLLYVGDPYFIRGYSSNSYAAYQCTTVIYGASNCAAYTRLLGSSIAVINAEFRIPLFGVPQFGLINFPYLPTELAPFFDGGLAWSKGMPPNITLNPNATGQIPVFSAGLSVRTNILGYLITEFYIAHPFQTPGTKTQFGFQLLPGW